MLSLNKIHSDKINSKSFGIIKLFCNKTSQNTWKREIWKLSRKLICQVHPHINIQLGKYYSAEKNELI